MGRSGGGGGGRSGGGGAGGGRSSGGFSGGARGGSGGRSGPVGARGGMGRVPRVGMPGFGMGGPRGPVFGPPPRRRRPGSGFGGAFLGGMLGSAAGNAATGRNSANDDRPSTGCGCGTLFIVVCAILLVVVLATSFGCGGTTFGSGSGSSQAQVESTVDRTRLAEGTAVVTALYTDEDGDWIHTPAALESGLTAFYNRTGVAPYVYILPNGSVTSSSACSAKATELYDQLFDDEGHFLMVFCDDGSGGYVWGYCGGSATTSVMDSEAVRILAQNLEKYYNTTSISDEEVFSKTFDDTGRTIMGAPAGRTRAIAIGVVVGAVVVGGVAYVVVKKRKEKQAAEQKRIDDLLNTPLETFGDQSLEDLEKKYEDKPAGGDASAQDASTKDGH